MGGLESVGSHHEKFQTCVQNAACLEEIEKLLSEGDFIPESQKRQQEKLRTWAVGSMESTGSGKSDPRIVTLVDPNGGKPLQAIFKPYQGGRLQGRRSGDESIAAEITSYYVNNAMGLKNTPTSVIRTLTLDGASVTGFLAVYKGGTSLDLLSLSKRSRIFRQNRRLANAMVIFDYVIGNGDRGVPWSQSDDGQKKNEGNFIYQERMLSIIPWKMKGSRFIAIDHGDAFNYGGKWDPAKRKAYYMERPIPPKIAKEIRALLKDKEKLNKLVKIVALLNGDDVARQFRRRLLRVGKSLNGNTVELPKPAGM